MVEQATVVTGVQETPLAPGQTMPADAPKDDDLKANDHTKIPVTPEKPVVPEKFRNADGTVNQEALIASYNELESKQSTQKPDDDANKNVDVKDADKDANKDANKGQDLKVVEPSYGEQIDGVLNKAGLTPATVAQEFEDTGKVSESTFVALEQAGFPRDLVNQYVEGRVAQLNAVTTDAAASDLRVANAKDSVGGESEYDAMASWASSNLSPTESHAFNAAIEGDAATVDMAIKGLHAKYTAAVGTSANLTFGGAGGNRGDVYRSSEEASDALHAAQVSRDPAKIAAAQEKALRSNTFG